MLCMKKGESGRQKDRSSQQLDAALRKLERAEEQMECTCQHKGSALPKSFDKFSSYFGPVVLSSVPDICSNITKPSWLLSEKPPTLTLLSTLHGKESVTTP